MDKRLEALNKYALENRATLAVMNSLVRATKYTGILDVVLRAGSLEDVADKLGVTYQAVQQWLKIGYVPLGRIPEIESIYGVPRADLMNPKYAAALAAPTFPTDA
jgi:transcriptional regulator with XRE-family HTH domain